MVYEYSFHPKCQDEISKSCMKNPVLEKALRNKILQIIENPEHYKPLKYNLAGERRVHILKSFVLKFEVDEQKHEVRFLFFGHHDDAYSR